jgi:hypothetical protein
MSFVKSLRPEFWQATPETRTEISGTKATIGPLEIWEYRGMASNVGIDQPDKLEPGHTLGQTIRVPEGGKLSSVQVRLPTWNSKTSSATISLFHESRLINSRRMENVPDNSWQGIEYDYDYEYEYEAGAGEYTVEISDPVGDIGWWSSKTDTTSFGEALADGKPVPVDRAIQAHTYALVGSGSMSLVLVGSKLKVTAVFTQTAEMQYKTFPWRWITTWTQDGYDCTPASGTVFSRFFTDNQRYMPIEQLKRRPNGGLRFDGFRWLEMDGTRDADLRLESGPMHLHWEMRPDEMHLRFDTICSLAPCGRSRGHEALGGGEKNAHKGLGYRTHFTLDVKPREHSVPHEFPHFACSDKALEADLNRLWWERAFTYGSPPNRCIEFSEWMAIMRSWYEGPREAEMNHLADYPMTDEGYVHTYGDIVGWPLVPNRDTRHFDTNARFILACWRHYMWTGDLAFLQGQAERLRKAMAYQLDVLRGRDGLIVTPDFRTGRHEDLSNNYWDILPFGHLDAYANAVFYGSLQAMAEMEEALGSEHRTSNVQLRTSNEYRDLAKKAHSRYDEVFWNEKAGRYVGCVDIDGVAHDYGFTFVNLEALYYGLGDAEKARRIYRWMETEPTSSGEADTYSKWIFAPRATTIHNPQWPLPPSPPPSLSPSPSPWWTYWWPGTPFGDQCQDGGAILYTSFFDLMDRARYRGADNAWQRFVEIIERYRMPDRLCGGSPLYRGEVSQQENAGAVGVDYPFAESGMVPLYFLYGVMGIDATPDGLRITPRLPKALSYAEVRDVHWRGMTLRIRVTSAEVEIDGFDAGHEAFKRTFAIKPGESVVLEDQFLSE